MNSTAGNMDGQDRREHALRERGRLKEQFDDTGQQHATAQFGMWVFLATEVLFFGVLFAGYAVCRSRNPEAFLLGSQHTEIVFGAAEACILLLSSATVTFAVNLIKFDQRRLVTALLVFTALLGVTFLILHGIEYSHEYDEHLMVGVDWGPHGPYSRGMELFFFLYYAMTLYHSLHVLVGVCVIGTMATLTWRRRISSEYTTPLVLGGLYWHLVDIVWIFLFPLMYLIGR
ncbi:MAG TPA: cytochrome c oxidase subunit 3 [Rhodanobacteraceae bacterium]